MSEHQDPQQPKQKRQLSEPVWRSIRAKQKQKKEKQHTSTSLGRGARSMEIVMCREPRGSHFGLEEPHRLRVNATTADEQDTAESIAKQRAPIKSHNSKPPSVQSAVPY